MEWDEICSGLWQEMFFMFRRSQKQIRVWENTILENTTKDSRGEGNDSHP